MTVATLLVKVTLTLVLALLAVRLAHRTRASVRHVLLAGTFAVLLVLPVASWFVPAVSITIPVATQVATVPQIGNPIPDVTPAPFAGTPLTLAGPDQSQPPWLSWRQALIGIWAAGVALFFVPVVVGLWHVRRLRRSALPWPDGQSRVDAMASAAGIGRRVQVLLHESLPGPMTCGMRTPAIILPADVMTWAPDDVYRAMVHELEHVRRGDWVSQCLSRAVAACYWFHPLVWVAWRQLVLEAERSCDDAVLRASGAEEYADQLVQLANRLWTARQPHLAMANRSDLATRVLAVLDDDQRRGRAGVACVAVAAGVCAVLVLTLSPLHVVSAAHQSAAAAAKARQTFDVVSVKPCTRDAPGQTRGDGRVPITSPGRLYLQCYPISTMLTEAYLYFADGRAHGLSSVLNVVVEGGPEWIGSERYTIEASTSQVLPAAVMRGPMLQTVLEDRFKLKIRRLTREMPVYELVIAKSGAKVSPYTGTDCVIRDQAVWPPAVLAEGQRYCGDRSRAEGDRFIREGVLALDELVSLWRFDYPVVNKTGISAPVSYRLEFPTGIGRMDEAPEESWLSALRNQLGLDLRVAKAPREYLVIDHVERPAPNDPLASPITRR